MRPATRRATRTGALNSAPDEATGCTGQPVQNGDLDFDGTPYWPEWPTGSQPDGEAARELRRGAADDRRQAVLGVLHPDRHRAERVDLQWNRPRHRVHGAARRPGRFYPYWSRVNSFGGRCALEFGNVSSGPGVNDFGGDAQYGTDQIADARLSRVRGPVFSNTLRLPLAVTDSDLA